MKDPLFIIVDLFCGAGGTTTGFVQAELEGKGIAKVIACINHDHKAITSHWQNHPEVKHFEEDIRTLDLTDLILLTQAYQKQHPDALLILWASLECTNFSKAKGGQPRDADSRTLADHLDRYIIALNPDIIQIENVVEFMSWGPLNEHGKPVSKKNGQDWMRWRKLICSHGYNDEWNELNSANYGAHTSRNRLFGMFARNWIPTVWPEPTHAKKPTQFSMHGDLQKWKAVKEVLDFSDEGESIFTRKIPLVDPSLERIYAGLVKFVGSAKLVHAEFLAAYYGNGHNISSVNDPCPVIPTKDRFGIVQPKYFIDKQYGSGNHNHSSIEDPAGTVLPFPKMNLVQCVPFIMPTHYDNKPKSIDEPCPTITANRKHHYLVNPSHGGHSTSTENPCPVIVARQDKAPLYLVQTKEGCVSVPIYEGDSEVMIRIKQFMAAYNIVDIKMRMLRVHELLSIQGFPVGYKLEGSQADQKKFIGNSVVPLVVKKWTEALGLRLLQNKTNVA